MKKFIFLFCMMIFSTSSTAQTQNLTLIERARQQRLELVHKQDELLELLLQTPFEQRQYIFPLLSAQKSVPKKIKTHPEVLVWKGKKPTRIADCFKDDPELIEYLPEQFYSFLSPDMWPSEGQSAFEINPNRILQNMLQQNKISEPSVMPEELVDIYDGLKILQELNQQSNPKPVLPIYFEQLIASAPQDIRQRIQEKTTMKPQEFGTKVDRIAQSYRLYQKQKVPPSSSEQKLVQEYWSLIPFIFQKTGFSNTLDSRSYPD